MADNNIILRFNKVFFEFGHTKPILNEADFSLRRGMKVALMGQNGAGKSTIFNLITGVKTPDEGMISMEDGMSIAIGKQVITADKMDGTVKEFFESCFAKKVYDIDPRIEKILEVVHLVIAPERIVRTLSGGQQARLLLASALIQEPDLLLLDEPTNNLDKEGLLHLTQFLIDYKKTCIVISHDADFLNAFTSGVLYLDVFTHKVEQYAGNYLNVVAEITARIERERRKNMRLEKEIQHRKEQAGFFGQKGGHMRDVARKMREKIETLEEDRVDMREEDKMIRRFVIPPQEHLSGKIITITSVPIMEKGKLTKKKIALTLKPKNHLLVTGPNGIGKTTVLHNIAMGTASGVEIDKGIRVGYYQQDFSTLDPEKTAYHSLEVAIGNEGREETIRSVAAGFLLGADVLKSLVGNLSEGQKGLLVFAGLVLQRPGLLILDEPTNHINFRHLPVIAEALNKYEGAMILVSHIPEFVKQIRIDETLDLEALISKKSS
ncbi:MAG: ABC-F family ATP-binding cassette domain-containing protein [Parcubacteria group bacterium]|nr:ABC-F family ATP-binding cassette domain-containing protein [Parcubacteria group bacterium]